MRLSKRIRWRCDHQKGSKEDSLEPEVAFMRAEPAQGLAGDVVSRDSAGSARARVH